MSTIQLILAVVSHRYVIGTAVAVILYLSFGVYAANYQKKRHVSVRMHRTVAQQPHDATSAGESAAEPNEGETAVG